MRLERLASDQHQRGPKDPLAKVEYHDISSIQTLLRMDRSPVPKRRVHREVVSRMRHYEVMVIFDAGLEEDGIRTIVDRVTQIITNGGGTVNKVDRWGKRRFAYEVHHRTEGYYVLIGTTTEPPVVADIDRVLGLADDVIRHKVIRLPDKVVARASSRPAGSDASPAEANANGAN